MYVNGKLTALEFDVTLDGGSFWWQNQHLNKN
jgi:hypothetical protein